MLHCGQCFPYDITLYIFLFSAKCNFIVHVLVIAILNLLRPTKLGLGRVRDRKGVGPAVVYK